MYVHALRFYLSHLSLYQFGDFYIWCEASICFIFSPFNFSLCGYLIVLAPFIAKIVFPTAVEFQFSINQISLYVWVCIWSFCSVSLVHWSFCLFLHQYYSCLFNKSWDLVEQGFLPYSSIVSNSPLVFYTSQCILFIYFFSMHFRIILSSSKRKKTCWDFWLGLHWVHRLLWGEPTSL